MVFMDLSLFWDTVSDGDVKNSPNLQRKNIIFAASFFNLLSSPLPLRMHAEMKGYLTHSQSVKRIKRTSSISCHLDRTNLVEEFLDRRKKIFLTGTLREIPSGLLPQVANQNPRFASFRPLVEAIHNKRILCVMIECRCFYCCTAAESSIIIT